MAALSVLVVGAYAPGSPAQEDNLASAAPPERRLHSDWSFEFGAGALALPSFPGASSTKVIPLPWIDLHYKDLFFLSPISGLGVNLVAVPGARLGIALLPDLGRSASDANRLRGFGDIGTGADLRLFGQLRVIGPVAVLAGVRRQLGGGNGTLVEGGLTSKLRLLPHLFVTATGTVTWGNARCTQAYFGVGAAQSATALSFVLDYQFAPVQIIAIAFSLAAFPVLSQAFAEGQGGLFRRVLIQNVVTIGESGLPREKMVVWRKEVEDLIGLEEAYKIEAATVEH